MEENKEKNGFLIGILSILIFVIIILIVLIFISISNNGSDESAPIQKEETSQAENDISQENITTTDEIIKYYQEKINNAASNEEKVSLYQEKINAVFKNDNSFEHMEQIMLDQIEIYKLEPNNANAIQVINYAYSCGREDVAKEYKKIAELETAE